MNDRVDVSTADRIAEAAITIVAREGFDVLSVRTVAREAGLSGGAVQYHFAARSTMLLVAFARTVHSISRRLAAVDTTGPLPVVLGRLCREALPLDSQRHRECAVWAALSAAAASHPELAVEHAKALNVFTLVMTQAIKAARQQGHVDDAVDPAAAAAVLIAVLDGLTLQGISGNRSPTDLTATLDTAIGLVLRQGPAT